MNRAGVASVHLLSRHAHTTHTDRHEFKCRFIDLLSSDQKYKKYLYKS